MSEFHPKIWFRKKTIGLAAIAFVSALTISSCMAAEVQSVSPLTLFPVPVGLVTPTPDARFTLYAKKSDVIAIVRENIADYCRVMGCDPLYLLGSPPKIRFNGQSNPPVCMSAYSDPKEFNIDNSCLNPENAGKVFHEAGHLDTIGRIGLPISIFQKAISKNLLPKITPNTSAYVDGFRLYYLPDGQEEDYLTKNIEEGSADAAEKLYYEAKGQRVDPYYGIRGGFLLFLGDRYHIDPMEIIRMKRNGELFKFVQKITGKANDVIGAMALEEVMTNDYRGNNILNQNPSSDDEPIYTEKLLEFWNRYLRYSPLQ